MYKNKNSELILIFAIASLFVIANIAWLWLFRMDQLLDIDEAGYLSYSLVDYNAFISNGFMGWVKTIVAPSIQAPLTTALTSVVYMIFGPKIFIGFVIMVFFGVATIAASYYLGNFVGDARLGLMTGILVATCPLVINYARSYSFALPAAAVTTMALLALVRSKQLTNIKWSVVFGLCVGLMPLARTMTIAFIPGLIIPVALYIVMKSDNRWLRIKNTTLAAVVGIVVAAIWLVPNKNGLAVFQYLTSFGYGNRVVEYAAAHESRGVLQNLTSWPAWLETIQYAVNSIYLPDAILVLFGFGLSLILFLKMSFINKAHQTCVVAINSKMFSVFIFIIWCFIALASSQNKGTGFLLPIVPAMFLMSVWAIMQLNHGKWSNAAITGIIFVVSAISSVPLMYLTSPIAKPWVVNIPIFGGAKVTDGCGNIQGYLSAGGYHTSNPVLPIDAQTSKQWVRASLATAQRLRQVNANSAAFGFRGYVYNVNTVTLQHWLANQKGLSLIQIEPVVTGDSKAGYLQWLTKGDAARAFTLVTAQKGQGDILPAVTDKYMDEAAREAGFLPLSSMLLPDARIITFWERRSPINIDFTKLKPIDKTTLYSIDMINNSNSEEQKYQIKLNSKNNDFCNIEGWAVDSNAGLPAGGVFFNIDGKVNIPALYGIERQDVADSYKNKNYKYSGFSGNLAIYSLSKGEHVLLVKVITHDKKHYYQLDRKIIIIIK